MTNLTIEMSNDDKVLIGFIEINYLKMSDYFHNKYGIRSTHFDFYTVFHDLEENMPEGLVKMTQHASFRSNKVIDLLRTIRNLRKYSQSTTGDDEHEQRLQRAFENTERAESTQG